MRFISPVRILTIKRYFSTPILYTRKLKSYTKTPERNIVHHIFNRQCDKTITASRKLMHDDHYFDEEEINEISERGGYILKYPNSVKHTLYPNSADPTIHVLNNCASVREVLDFTKKYDQSLSNTHLTQTVLVLWDLQNMFYHVSLYNDPLSFTGPVTLNEMRNNYLNKLKVDADFLKIMELIIKKRDELNLEQLSYIFLHLHLMGFNVKEHVMQVLIEEFRRKFTCDNKNLGNVSRYVTALRSTKDLGFFYIVKDVVPFIFDQIENCDTSEDIKLLTICLSKTNEYVTYNVIKRYINKVEQLLSTNVLNAEDHGAILKVIVFLNFNWWKEMCTQYISRYILLFKNRCHLLSVNELLTLYYVIYQIQEPGEILNEIQRCASKQLFQLEEEELPLLHIRLKLLTCIIYFSTPAHRPRVERIIRKYIDYKLDGYSLLELFKLLSSVKVTDKEICKTFWDKTLWSLDDPTFRADYLLKICSNYLKYNRICKHNSHREFETRTLVWLKNEICNDITFLEPTKFVIVASFIMTFCQTQDLLNMVVTKINETKGILSIRDSVILTRNLLHAIQKNEELRNFDLSHLVKCINESLSKYNFHDSEMVKRNQLLQSRIYLNEISRQNLEQIDVANVYDNVDVHSSIFCNSAIFILQSTNTLLPELMNKMVKYVVTNENHVLGLYAGKLLYNCYLFDFLPEDSNNFFDTVIRIIIRDQERFNGLLYLQTCLALCYFDVLPISFIQQIFNVEFLQKLDIELMNCYSKYLYPIRLTKTLMQLNRAVALDYPQVNVRWFHQKYVENVKNNLECTKRNNKFATSVMEHLHHVIQKRELVKMNVLTPYGYYIDFVVYLDKKGVITNEENAVEKIAILLLENNAYSNHTVQLKGEYQLKIRHLGILGYKVKIIKHSDWDKLIYGQEKNNYIKEFLTSI